MVKGRDTPFDHRDRNTLIKVADADLNPWARLIRDKKSTPSGKQGK